MKSVNTLFAVVLVLGGGTVQAGLIDAGFENGFGTCDVNKYNCWIPHLSAGNQATGALIKTPSFASPNNPPNGSNTPPFLYYPPEGQHFLALYADSAPADIWQTVTQLFKVDVAGEILSGFAAFDWNDTAIVSAGVFSYDGAKVSIFRGNTTTATALFDTPFSETGQSFPNPSYPCTAPVTCTQYINYANGPWTKWQSIALPVGTYTIEYAVRNTGDNGGPSYGYFDAIPATVPESASLALYVTGLLSLSSMQRRRTVSLPRSS